MLLAASYRFRGAWSHWLHRLGGGCTDCVAWLCDCGRHDDLCPRVPRSGPDEFVAVKSALDTLHRLSRR
jgi:hypothetical protein